MAALIEIIPRICQFVSFFSPKLFKIERGNIKYISK